jgi:putative endonuclease
MPSPTQVRGTFHEAHAEAELVRLGYRIIDRNWRGGGGEIDRIALDGDILAFVEIRSRSSAAFGSPLETVRFGKQQRVIRAAVAYLAALPPGKVPMARFDVVSLTEVEGGGVAVEVVRNAFTPGDRRCWML